MNTGVQDAFNLGWKLALACRGGNEDALLDSYEAERRPVALRIVATGDAFDSNQTMTEQRERAARDIAMRQTFSEPSSVHHEAVAAAELDRSYADSDLVMGDRNDRLAPGDLLPTTSAVLPAVGEACALHELTHRPGHTVLVLGGMDAAGADVLDLAATLKVACGESQVVDAVIGLCVRPEDLPIGGMDESVAQQLGVQGLTVLAVRPDRYVGFRHDGTDPGALAPYLDAFAR